MPIFSQSLTRAAQQQLPSHDRQEVDYENFRKLVLAGSLSTMGFESAAHQRSQMFRENQSADVAIRSKSVLIGLSVVRRCKEAMDVSVCRYAEAGNFALCVDRCRPQQIQRRMGSEIVEVLWSATTLPKNGAGDAVSIERLSYGIALVRGCHSTAANPPGQQAQHWDAGVPAPEER